MKTTISFSTISQIIISSSIIASLVYDMGFYFGLGISFTSIPSSISDSIYNSLTWLPWVFILFILSFIFNYTSESERVSYKKKSPIHDRIINILILFLLIIFYILLGDIFVMALPIVFMTTWQLLLKYWIIPWHIDVFKTMPLWIYDAINNIPNALFFIALLGYSNASQNILLKTKNQILYYTDNTKDLNSTILKSSNNGYLIKHENKIIYVQNKYVKKIELISNPTVFEGLGFK